MNDTIVFMGRTLKRDQLDGDGNHWSTPNCDPWPMLSVGKEVGGKWFAFVHFVGVPSIGAQFKPSKRAALEHIRKRVRSLGNQLANLDWKAKR